MRQDEENIGKINLPDDIPVRGEIGMPEAYDGDFIRIQMRWWIFDRYQFRKAVLQSHLSQPPCFTNPYNATAKMFKEAILRHWEALDQMLKSPFGCCCADANNLTERIKSFPEGPEYHRFGWINRIRGRIWKVRILWHCRKEIIALVFALNERL